VSASEIHAISASASRVAGELRRQREQVERPVAEGGRVGARDPQHQHGPDAVERVAQLDHRAVDGRVSAQIARQPPQQQPCRDEQRHGGDRQQEQHRDQHELGRDRRDDPALELDS
jgi:hypothetical protein